MKKICILFLFIFGVVFLLPKNSHAIEVKDYFERKIKIPKKPKRIVSLTPATTEILFALGLKNKIVAVTNDCNYPAEALKKEKVGKFGFINLEKLVSLKPDIIFATKDMKKSLDILKNSKIPLIAIETPNIRSIITGIEVIGNLTNKKDKAISIKKDFEKRLKVVIDTSKKITRKPKVFYCIWHDPLMTAGEKSFAGDMLNIVGADNIAKDIKSSFSQYNIESLISGNPDYLIIPESNYSKINFTSFPWSKLRAVRNEKIIRVNDDIYLRPSPRVIIAIEELQKKLLK